MADADDKVIDEEVDAVFDTKKKKKKKLKKEGEEGGAAEEAGGAEGDEDDVFSSSKKKKKKSKERKEGAEEGDAATGEADEDDVDAVFTSSKKKKKSKEKGGDELVIDDEEGGAAAGGGDAEDDEDLIDNAFESKKKKKKSKKKDKGGEEGGEEEALSTEANYSYDELLQRVQILLTGGDSTGALPGRVPIKMPPIALVRIGTKKTRWDNFQEICTCMNRMLDHVKQFVEAELGTEGSVDGNNRLVLRGKYVPKYIESLLRKYIGEYVACSTCRSPNTDLTRDAVSRLYFVHCKSCGSSRSVGTIRSGFHAQTRADRRALRK